MTVSDVLVAKQRCVLALAEASWSEDIAGSDTAS